MKISNLTPNPIDQINTKNSSSQTTTFKKILQAAQETNDAKSLKAACANFEEVFTNILLKNMRRTVIEGGLLEKSHAREMFEGMLDEKLAKEISKGQGIGLSKIMYEQLSKNMENKE